MALVAVQTWWLFTLIATHSWIHVVMSQNMPTPANLPQMFRPAGAGAPVGNPGQQIAVPALPGASVPAPTLPVAGPAAGFPIGVLPVPSSSNFLGLFGYTGQPNVVSGLCTFGCPPLGVINVPPTQPPPTQPPPPPPTAPPPSAPPPVIIPYPVGCPILACLCQLCACPVCTTCGIGGIGVGGIGGLGGIGGIGFG